MGPNSRRTRTQNRGEARRGEANRPDGSWLRWARVVGFGELTRSLFSRFLLLLLLPALVVSHRLPCAVLDWRHFCRPELASDRPGMFVRQANEIQLFPALRSLLRVNILVRHDKHSILNGVRMLKVGILLARPCHRASVLFAGFTPIESNRIISFHLLHSIAFHHRTTRAPTVGYRHLRANARLAAKREPEPKPNQTKPNS